MRIREKRKRQRGVALLLAIFSLVLLSAIGLAMLYSADTETMISVNYRDKQAAIYGALAGLQEARDRMHPLTGDLGTGVNLSAGGLGILPTALPSTSAANVLYIINPAPGETVAPWDYRNKYFDTELCQEAYIANTFPGVTQGTPGVPCQATSASAPTGSAWYRWYDNSQKKWFDSTNTTGTTGTGGAAAIETAYQPKDSGGNKIPLTYKWVRITLKSDNMTPVPAGTGDATQVCWQGNTQTQTGHEQMLPAGYHTDCTPPTGGVTNIAVTVNGSGYTSPPTVTISGGSGSGATAVATCPQPDGTDPCFRQLPAGITSVTLTNAGAGYTSVPAVTVTPADGLGSGALVNASINATLPVSSVVRTAPPNWASPPACYPGTTPTVTFNPAGAAASVTMTGSSCIYSFNASGRCTAKNLTNVPVTASNGSGTVAFAGTIGSNGSNKAAINPAVSNPGSYTAVPTTFSVGAACTGVVITATPGIQISTISVTNGGAYSAGAPPSVTLSGGFVGGSPAATATLSGTASPGPVTSIVIPSGGNGSGYDMNPTLTIAPPCIPLSACGGVQATGTASIAADKGIMGIKITNPGSGYTPAFPPTVTITGGGGSGATATATVGSAGNSMGRTYLVTSLAVMPSGARAMLQSELGVNYDTFTLGLGGALTLVGPNPVFGTPHSMPFQIIGSDCPTCTPGPPGCNTTPKASLDAIGVDDPTGATNPSAVQTVINDLAKPNNYIGLNSAPDVHNANLGKLTATELNQFVDQAASVATNQYGTRAAPVSNPTINLGSVGNPAIDVVYGDYTMGPTTGYGILVVTGTLSFHGNYSWNGLILVIGAGASVMSGGGNGQINGSVFVADTAGGTLSFPSVNWNGGGGNGVQYDHCWADDMISKIPKVQTLSAGPLQVISLRNEVY